MTCRLANALKSHGVRKGDRVAIYMPMSPLAVAAMLACARIGAVHRLVHKVHIYKLQHGHVAFVYLILLPSPPFSSPPLSFLLEQCCVHRV